MCHRNLNPFIKRRIRRRVPGVTAVVAHIGRPAQARVPALLKEFQRLHDAGVGIIRLSIRCDDIRAVGAGSPQNPVPGIRVERVGALVQLGLKFCQIRVEIVIGPAPLRKHFGRGLFHSGLLDHIHVVPESRTADRFAGAIDFTKPFGIHEPIRIVRLRRKLFLRNLIQDVVGGHNAHVIGRGVHNVHIEPAGRVFLNRYNAAVFPGRVGTVGECSFEVVFLFNPFQPLFAEISVLLRQVFIFLIGVPSSQTVENDFLAS